MSANSLESWIRRMANRCGLDVTRYRPEVTESGRLAAMLAHHGVNLVLDVGANVGQFAASLRRSGYRGRMLSFEPLGDAHARLLVAARGDPHWEVAPRVAIGDRDGEIERAILQPSVGLPAVTKRESNGAHGDARRR